MAEFFLELFSEEIPARMQAGAAAELQRRCLNALQILKPADARTWFSVRRIAFAATVADMAGSGFADLVERAGPRIGAPAEIVEKFKAGFVRDHGSIDALVEKNGKYIAQIRLHAATAMEVIEGQLSLAIQDFPWPKSMRWGQSGAFKWVRPLRRIVCLLDGDIVPISLGPVTASNRTEGHRFLAPGSFEVTGSAQWEMELQQRSVIADADKRRDAIESGLDVRAAAHDLSIVKDPKLLDEVAGLIEYPVPLIGRIETRFMMLPPEVRELSMKVNQRYFATRDAAGAPAPFFGFVANIEAADGGAAIVAGNERVLRARLADAEYFWTLDRQHPLEYYLPKLETVTFHAKLGSQFDRANRISVLAREIAELLGATSTQADQAEQAGRLCKADLVTGMIGEFPELQGILGGYYADDPVVGAAITTHYQPKGPSDALPDGIVACAVALADKIDTLRGFFRIDEKPTGSSDPYALRRAALGVIRIALSLGKPLPLNSLLKNSELFEFIVDRFKVTLRGEGKRFDVINAVLAAEPDDDLQRIQKRANALEEFIATDDGANLLVAYRRAANILRIEEAKDGSITGKVIQETLIEPAEKALDDALGIARVQLKAIPIQLGFGVLLRNLATLRLPIDTFFNDVTVNADDPKLRRNRLRLLAIMRDTINKIADFSKLEG